MTTGVSIRDLRVETHIGVTDAERAKSQWVLVSCELETNPQAAAASDDVTDTVDYGVAVEKVAALVRSGERNLLERLASEIADLLMSFIGVDGVTVEVSKEAPPIPEEIGGVAVRIERRA